MYLKFCESLRVYITNATSGLARHFERVSAEDVRRAAEYQAAILADVAGRRGTLHGRIKPLAPHMSVAGPAITVEVRPGDNLAIHAAMAVAQPGDVLIVDGKGDLRAAWRNHGHSGSGERHCGHYY